MTKWLPFSKQPPEIKAKLLEVFREERSYIQRELKEATASGKDATDVIRRLKLIRKYIRRVSRKPSLAQR